MERLGAAMSYDLINRRFFLRSAGGLTLALPFLGSLASRAKAEEANAVLDSVIFFRMDYTWGYNNVKPAPGLTYEDLGQGMRRAPLPADFSQWGASYAKANAKLASLRNHICHIMGLDYTGVRGDHWNSCFLNGSSRMFSAVDTSAPDELTWETIDQLMGRKIYNKRGIAAAINTIVVGSNDFGRWASILNTDGSTAVPATTYNKGNLANVAHHDVVDLYKALFDGIAATAAAGKATDYSDQKMLNLVYSDYKSLLANPRLSHIDNQNLQNYIALLSDFENRLAAKKSIKCAPPGVVPDNQHDSGYYEPEQSMKDLMPILASALACGASKIVNMCLYSANLQAIGSVVTSNNQALPAASQSDYHHGIIHSIGGFETGGSSDRPTPYPRALAYASDVDAYYLGVIADFATTLQGFVDQATGETLLDKTALVLGREHGTSGPAQDVHMLRDIHLLVLGGTRAFNSGYFYDYKTSTPTGPDYGGDAERKFLGLPYNDFLYAMMLSMGLSPSDWELGGQPGYGYTSTTAMANGGNGGKYYVRDMRSPPPKLLKAG